MLFFWIAQTGALHFQIVFIFNDFCLNQKKTVFTDLH